MSKEEDDKTRWVTEEEFEELMDFFEESTLDELLTAQEFIKKLREQNADPQ